MNYSGAVRDAPDEGMSLRKRTQSAEHRCGHLLGSGRRFATHGNDPARDCEQVLDAVAHLACEHLLMIKRLPQKFFLQAKCCGVQDHPQRKPCKCSEFCHHPRVTAVKMVLLIMRDDPKGSRWRGTRGVQRQQKDLA